MKTLKRTTLLLILLLLTVIAGVSGSPLAEAEWQVEIVDGGISNDVGKYSSIALDVQGAPYISYYDAGNGDLKFAKWLGEELTPASVWAVETVDWNGDVGKYSSLAVDAGGFAHISYYDESNHDLRYAQQQDGGGWRTETVDFVVLGDVGRYSSLALDANDNPHISYYEGYPNGNLKYAYFDENDWISETVDYAGDVGQYSSLALDEDGFPHISYFYSDEDQIMKLKYSYKYPGGWEFRDPQTDPNAIPLGVSSLALDRQDNPHIAFVQQTSEVTPTYELVYIYWDGIWQSEIVDVLAGSDGKVSMTLDRSGNPHIGYYDGFNDDLKYATRTSEGWDIEVVDSEGDVGSYPSLALDRYGLPHISYRDDTLGTYDLKYATLPFILRQSYIPLTLQEWVRYYAWPFEKEDNDAAWQANGALTFGQEYIGYHNDENDFFSVYLRAGSTLNIDLVTEHLELDESGYYVVQLMLYYGSTSPEDRVVRVFEPPYQIEFTGSEGWYYVRIYTAPGYLDGSKQYQLTVATP